MQASGGVLPGGATDDDDNRWMDQSINQTE